MNIKEKFKRQGLGLEWGRNKVILTVGREKHKIDPAQPPLDRGGGDTRK